MTPEEYVAEVERIERAEHNDALLDIRAILSSPSGVRFFKYLFKNFDVCDQPELGLEGNFLHERLGFLRAGNSIFKLVSEADPAKAATILAKNERERYDKLYADYALNNG